MNTLCRGIDQNCLLSRARLRRCARDVLGMTAMLCSVVAPWASANPPAHQHLWDDTDTAYDHTFDIGCSVDNAPSRMAVRQVCAIGAMGHDDDHCKEQENMEGCPFTAHPVYGGGYVEDELDWENAQWTDNGAGGAFGHMHGDSFEPGTDAEHKYITHYKAGLTPGTANLQVTVDDKGQILWDHDNDPNTDPVVVTTFDDAAKQSPPREIVIFKLEVDSPPPALYAGDTEGYRESREFYKDVKIKATPALTDLDVLLRFKYLPNPDWIGDQPADNNNDGTYTARWNIRTRRRSYALRGTAEGYEPAEHHWSEPYAIRKGDQAYRSGLDWVGTPYCMGGEGPGCFDCSGFTQWCYEHVGIAIPRTAAAQEAEASDVDSPVKGELVFFQNTYKPGVSHVGLVCNADEKTLLHASSSSGVTVGSYGPGSDLYDNFHSYGTYFYSEERS